MALNRSKRLFILEGNIGAGKSTFLSLLKNYLNLDIIYEPHERWQSVGGDNILDKFYSNPERWAYTFQTYAFVTRILAQKEAFDNSKFEILISERSVFSDRYCFAKNCFENGIMNNLEWALYKDWFDRIVKEFEIEPSGFIYLKTDAETCYSRIQKRSRFEEAGLSLEYLQSLEKKHEHWLINKEDIAENLLSKPVLVLDVNKDFESDITLQKKHMMNLVNFLENQYSIAPAISLKERIV